MFKLKRVELLGFKSFADRTRVEFGEGTVAVVGPNGCGKSNLSDAISWVLGEQSARMLRGDRMADVIFNGTGTRLPTGLAEVSMTLVDPEATEPEPGLPESKVTKIPVAPALEANPIPADGAGADGNSAEDSTGAEPPAGSRNSSAAEPRRPALKFRGGEIVVTRRLFRSGESDYLINGESRRLRDIQDLFMGTGLGPESYAIIEQGRIGQILSSKPSDRRSIIEEAAGVSKFKTRKRLAEAKLESSRLNLSRITDILEEVTKQVNSLKRQASKARRYRELSGEIKGRLKTVLTSRLAAIEDECARFGQALAAIQEECSAASRELESREVEQKAVAARHEELESELTRLREAISQGEIDRERLSSRLEQARQSLITLNARSAEASAECEERRAQLALIEGESQEQARRAEAVREESDAARHALDALAASQSALAQEFAEGEARVEACRQEALRAVARGAELRNKLVQVEEAAVGLDRQAARIASEKAGIEHECARDSAELASMRSEQEQGESWLAGLERSASETAAALEEVREKAAHRQAEVERLRQEHAQASARRQALEESLARHAYSTESVRRLLSGNVPQNGHSFRPLGVLADFVEVAPGYEELVEGFLKTELDCVVVERHEEAQRGIALLESEGTGRSTFFVTQLPSNGHSNGHGDADVRSAPGVMASVRELVRFQPRLGLNGDLILPALASAYVVESAGAAERLAVEYPQGHFLTPQGEHYHHRLVSGGKGQSAGPLALRRDFRELERRTAELEACLRAAEDAHREASVRAQGLDQELRNLSASKIEAEKKSALGNEKLRQCQAACERAGERLRVLEAEAAQAAAEQQSLEERRAALDAELQAATTDERGCEEQIIEAAQLLRDTRARLDQISRELSEAQARAAMLQERVQSVESDRARLRARADEVRLRLEQLAVQGSGWQEERRRLGQERIEIEARAQELEVSGKTAGARLQETEEEARQIKIRRNEINPAVDQARVALDARREKRSEVEVALARVESDRAHHAERCRQELGAEPAVLLAEQTPESRLEGEALGAAEEELRGLKSRLENLGPVNMMALEELQEAEDRFSFLETQRQDLLASIEDTAQAIREIDQVSRRQFLEAFEAINRYFAESFRTLFGGGVGEMRLSDESDAESGIDLVAQPPGKRLQNVLLLSGGEKALTALALLIAIFRFTPSPFCILDEVDAPLDDSNVTRFTSMIRQMGGQTQFILITHNKRTMEICPIMYGVTMQEPGVSKLVSVKFNTTEPERMAATA